MSRCFKCGQPLTTSGVCHCERKSQPFYAQVRTKEQIIEEIFKLLAELRNLD